MPRRVRLTETIQHDDGKTSEVPRQDVWPLSRYVHGYVYDRNGIATARYGQRSKSLGMPFARRNQVEAIREAERWVKSIVTGTAMPTTAPAAAVVTFAAAFAEYEATKLDASATDATERHRYRDATLAYVAYVLRDEPVTDESARRLTIDGVARMQRDGRRDRDGKLTGEMYSAGTVRRYAYAWGRFMAYCRAAGWITIDPVALVRLPDVPTKANGALVYSDDDLHRIDEWFATFSGPRRDGYRLLWRFLLYTGCRIHEALALEWSDVHPDYIGFRIAKGKRPRPFPLAPFPEVRPVLDDLRALRDLALRRERAEPRKRGGQPTKPASAFVIPNRDQQHTTEALRECLAALGIDGGPRPIHAFRATAKRRMGLSGIGAETAAYIMGHSVPTAISAYDAGRTAAELADAVARERG